jgi:cytochrome c55X
VRQQHKIKSGEVKVAHRAQFLYTVIFFSTLVAGSSATELPAQQRQEELVYLLHQDCGSCHGMTLQGGLGPSLLPVALAGKPAEYLRQVISKGIPEKAMPPWENILTPGEIDFLVTYLQQGPDQ